MVSTVTKEKAASLFKGGSPVDSADPLEKIARLWGINQSWPPEVFVLCEEVQSILILLLVWILKALSYEV